jgi:hypothetical protein
MTLVMYFAGAWGYLRLLKLPVPPGRLSALPAAGGSLLSNGSMLLALAALIATAVLAGLLAMLPSVSPLASGLPGLLLLGWTALYLVSVRRAVEFIPLRSHASGAGWEALLFNGLLGAAGAVMILPMLFPARWRAPRRARHGGSRSSVREVDDFLASVRSDDDSRRREEPALVGTVIGGPAGGLIAPVDTTRVTGASRALRATGSFPASTGPASTGPASTGPASTGPASTGDLPRTASGMPRRPTGNMPRITGSIPRVPRNTGSMPRATGSFRGTADSTLLGRPYAPASERDN